MLKRNIFMVIELTVREEKLLYIFADVQQIVLLAVCIVCTAVAWLVIYKVAKR